METNYKANIAFVISKSYIGQFKVTFNSLCNSNRNVDFFVHLLHSDLEENDKEDIKDFVEKRGCSIAFYEISEEDFKGLPKMQGDNSYSAYYKILLPYLLGDLNKVLFLDCDIIIRGSVLPLFETETNAFLSCVEDYKISRKRKEHVKKIIGNEDIIYFNSGVMLFDFSKSDEIVPKHELFEYISDNKEDIRWHDQDILNHFYAENCNILEEKYNYLTTYKSISDLFLGKGKKKAVVVHYANWKPWRPNYIGKFYGLYKKNYNLLKGEKGVDFLQKRSLKAQLELIFKYIF